ncbi:MAG TPA: hypothetical protein VGI93_06840 [Steroidobacteraceae bacterium]|jgi:hypothetical protein
MRKGLHNQAKLTSSVILLFGIISRRLGGLTLGFLLLLTASFLASASEPTPLSSLIDSAVALSGYERPEAPLSEQLLSPEAMADLVCHGHRCPIYAAYLDHDVLYLRTDIGDTDLADHLRFHEVIHWLQHHSGKFAGSDCNTRVAREREAYRLENRFISEVQHGIALMVIPPYDCPKAD